MNRTLLAAAAIALAATHAAAVDVTLLTQERTITARTSFDANAIAVAAPDFLPFNQTVTASVTFPTPGGGTAVNAATTTINCLANPNKMLASGTLSGAGGTAQVGAALQPVIGETRTFLSITFDVSAARAYRVSASPRPSTDPADAFELELKSLTTGDHLVAIDDTMPPQTVWVAGTLAPGRYSIKYKVEFTTRADAASAPYTFTLDLAPGCNPADVAGLGGASGGDGLLTADDVLVFLAAFFNADAATADMWTLGGASGPDGLLTADDIVGFLGAFFAGCP